MTDNDEPEQPSPPNQRSFSLNSPEGQAALCSQRQRPWILNGALSMEPRAWGPPVIVERGRR